MADAPAPAVVPPGERDALARTAQETGERFGRMASQIDEHARHFERLNGSVGHLATSVAEQATAMAVMATSLKVIADGIAATGAAGVRKEGMSMQWKLAIFGACLTVLGFIWTAIITLVVLLANHQL